MSSAGAPMDVGPAVGYPPASRMAIEQRRVNANRELGKLPGGRLMERVLGEDIRRSQWADLPCATWRAPPPGRAPSGGWRRGRSCLGFGGRGGKICCAAPNLRPGLRCTRCNCGCRISPPRQFVGVSLDQVI